MSANGKAVLDRRQTALPAAILLLLVLLPAVAPIGVIAADSAVLTSLAGELPRLRWLLVMTAVLAAGSLLLAVPLGTAVAVAAFRLRIPCRQPTWLLLTAAAATPLALYAGAWQAWVGPYGLVDPGRLTNRFDVRLLQAVAIHGLAAVPWVAGIVGMGLLLSDRNLEDPGRLEVSNGRVLSHITLPLTRPALVFATLFALASPLTDMTVTDLYRIRTFAEEVYTEVEERSNPHVSAVGNLALAAVLAAALAVLSRRRTPGLVPARMVFLPVDRSTVGWLIVGTTALIATVVPFFGLGWQLGLTADPVTRKLWWSADVATVILGRTAAIAGDVVVESLLLATAASLVASTAGFLIAWRVRWSGRTLGRIVVTLLVWLVVLPGPILAFGLIELLQRPEIVAWGHYLYDSRALVVYVQSVRVLPFVAAVWMAAMDRLDGSLFDSAALEGAGPWPLINGIALPMLRPVAGLAFAVGAALALTELPASKIVAPPGVDLFMLSVFSLLHNGTINEQAALCLVLLGTITTVASASYWAATRAFAAK
jgi:iron(III) transport system permease protein